MLGPFKPIGFLCLWQVGESGRAVGIDHIPELTALATKNIQKDPKLAELLERKQLKFVTGDGRVGYAEDGPYDAIHVGAAATEVPEAVSLDVMFSCFV